MTISFRTMCLAVAAGAVIASGAQAAEIQVLMLNKGTDGTAMTFEPALIKAQPGDTIHFVAKDKGHNVESIKGFSPAGFADVTGKMNEDLTVKLDKPGAYGFDCKPHYVMGMVALAIVGKPESLEEAKKTAATGNMPNLAKARFTKLFEKAEAK